MKTPEEILHEHGLKVYHRKEFANAFNAYASQFQQKWIPIEEGLPEDDKLSILLYSKAFNAQFIFQVKTVKEMKNSLQISHYQHITPNP